MSTLLRKELRELRPFLGLGAILLLLEFVHWLGQQADMEPLSATTAESSQAWAAVVFIMAFAAGTGLVVRELDGRTMAFLDGLPLSRARVFMAKVLVAAAVLMLYPVGSMLLMAAQHMAARQSLDHALHGVLLAQTVAMAAVVMGTGLALGLLLGYLRAQCWLVLGLMVLSVATLGHVFPGLSILNPLQLMEMRRVGLQWQVPTAALLTHLGVMVACMLLARGIFMSADGDGGRNLRQWSGRPVVSAGVTLLTIVVAIAVVVVSAWLSSDGARSPAGRGDAAVDFDESPLVTVRTTHYSFRYYSRQAAQATALIGQADRIHAEVASLLGAADGARIDVDLTGSMQNTEGTAFHDRIRMHLAATSPGTLAHETSHVLAHRLAGGERDREFMKMSALNEGLATWVQDQVARQDGVGETGRFVAAVVSRRRLVEPEDLTDMQAFARHADIQLQYPLGAALVESLVARHGRDAPNRLLRALAEPGFPRDLKGSELWHAAFQAAGFDLGVTFDDFTRRLRGWEAEFASRIDELPRPRLSLSYRPGEVGLELRWEGRMPEDWKPVVRLRPKANSSLDQYVWLVLGPDAQAWIRRGQLFDSQLCYQPGVFAAGAAIFEAWSCVPLQPGP
jgi:hypothetical protein